MVPPFISSSSGALMGPVSLPLFKLSHCTMLSHGSNMLWTHLPNRNDMFAVFDITRSRNPEGAVVEKEVLKLMRGGDLFELIEFDLLKREAQLDEQKAQSQSVPDHLLNVIIIAKRPLLALRYRLPDGQIRKVQMNFQPESGCDTAVERLKPLGLPMRDQHQARHHQPLRQRPYSSQSLYTSSSAPSQESRGTLLPMNDDVLHSAPQSQTLSRPISSRDSFIPPYGAVLPPPPPQPRRIEEQSISSKSGDEVHVPPSTHWPRFETTPKYPTDEDHTDSFSKPLSYIRDPRSPAQNPMTSISQNDGYPFFQRPISTSASIQIDTRTRMMPPASPALLPSPTFSNQSSFLGACGSRPMSAPNTRAEPFLIDHAPMSALLPPARELPFPKRSPDREIAAMPASLEESSVPKQDSKEPVQQKKKRATAKPKVAASPKLTRSSAPKARSKKSTAVGVPTDEVLSSNAPPKPCTAVETEPDKAPMSSAPPRTAPTLEVLEQTVSKLSKDLRSPSSRTSNEVLQKRPMSARDERECNKQRSTISDRQSSQAKPKESEHYRDGLSSVDPADFLDSLDGWIRKYHDIPVAQAPSTGKEELAAYASKSDEERHQMIDSIICECLQDENFGKLVDDVEGHWKRICLGF